MVCIHPWTDVLSPITPAHAISIAFRSHHPSVKLCRSCLSRLTDVGSWGQIRAQALDGRDRRRSPGGRYTLLHGARTHGFPLEGLHGRGCVLPQTRRVTPPRRAGLSEV